MVTNVALGVLGSSGPYAFDQLAAGELVAADRPGCRVRAVASER
jgi:hypothetical protein